MMYCNDCCEFFREEEADTRDARLEDSLRPWEKVMMCPYCGSEDLEEAGTCRRCGGPCLPGEDLCDVCEGDLYGIVNSAVENVGGEYLKAKDILFDYLEREWL